MGKQKSELEKMNIVRLSNKQANLVTKTCLQTALIELLDSKSINAITISELTRKAGVSRTAFYSNYQTINDVLTEFIESHLKKLNDYIWIAINHQEDLFYPIIKKIHDEFDLYSLLLKADIEKTAFLQIRDYIKKEYPHIDKNTYYKLIAVIGLLRNVIIEWVYNGCKDSVEFISRICNDSTENLREKIVHELK